MYNIFMICLNRDILIVRERIHAGLKFKYISSDEKNANSGNIVAIQMAEMSRIPPFGSIWGEAWWGLSESLKKDQLRTPH